MDSRRPIPHQIPNSNSNSSIPIMGYAHLHHHDSSSPSSPLTATATAAAAAAALKLPLAPIDRIRSNPNIITPLRRGSSIFSPSSQNPVLDPPPPPPSTDPDPPSSSTITPDVSHSTTPPLPPPPPPPPPTPGIKYRECLKNHAAAMGSHVVDGCGEFMPSTPDSLLCAACDCHRNFHRKETDSSTTTTHHGGQITYSVAPPHLRHRHKHQHQHQQTVVSASAPHQVVNFGAESSSEDLNIVHSGGTASGSASKKRYRTKFSSKQKEAMEEFAGKMGWRIQKEREEEVQRFCEEVGVARQVFKVWMHNNKQAAIKRRQS